MLSSNKDQSSDFVEDGSVEKRQRKKRASNWLLRYCIQVRKTFKQSKSEGKKTKQKTPHFVKNTCIRHPANIQKYNNKRSSGLWQAEALYIQLMFKSITRWTNISLLWLWSTLQLSTSTLKYIYIQRSTLKFTNKPDQHPDQHLCLETNPYYNS